MKTVIIGAQGFVGQRLAAQLLTHETTGRLVLIDRADPGDMPGDPRVECLTGDFADPDLFNSHIAGASTVYLLAAILGGAAEADYALARRVNIDATLTLIERLRDSNPMTRFVFASTIAVFAKPMPELVTDATPTGPTMVYGAQKLMMEAAIANFAARGWLDGVSLRLAGVMARDGADARMKSAFISRVFYAVMRSEDIVLPVHPHSRTWLTSVETAAANFVHAGQLPAAQFGAARAFTLPALCLTFEDLVAALFRRFPDSRAKVSYQPEEDLVALFGSYPPIATETADRLGFLRDSDADALVARSL
ncbi:NAD-dependent epimerase/dehydratase family protein [Allorhizobium sp. BGMRC 0089]|uniref:NAD-dependent epimerase/dehydratase family protein n=1 Tax=Allorhizobium sonneratiae TaxID=2934936 RepID=UPI0020335BAF|nr:NAD-dependent epimerase/dehydratase family protein [Allorhizobium sonneratiae]MCM2294011.1 NAD-dependent epimerase/dehydratase family protein [Allorhizobium sonneratiae]